jgi:hypothetical protein
MANSPKQYTVKVYDKSGTLYRGSYGQLSNYSFTSTINGGVGQLSIDLPRKFDEYNNDGAVNLLDSIQVWVQDKEGTVKIYSGYIDSISRTIRGNVEGVRVTCLGYASRFGFSIDWNGTTLTQDRNSQDPTDIIKDIIDDYRANYADPFINYTSTSTEDTGLTVSYQSDSKYIVESIERIRQMAGSGWYWFIDADNVFHFKQKPATPTHTFTMIKDISELTIDSVTSDIKNSVLFWNGLQSDDTNFIQKLYYSGTGATAYWKRFDKITDSRITDATTADSLGTAFIEANKDPNVTITFRVKDGNLGDGYDIESIKCGDTCRILGVKDSDLYLGNLQITSINYTPEYVDITVEDKRALTGRRLTDVRRSLDNTVYSDGVATVTLDDID